MPFPHPWSCSSITLATVNGRHQLKIDRYSLTKTVPNGDYFKSATFQVAGYSWHINYFPMGLIDGRGVLREGTHDPVSLQIVPDGDSAAAFAAAAIAGAPKAFFSVCLLNQDGVPMLATMHSIRSQLPLVGGCWFVNFVSKADLERPDHGLLANDSFTVQCDFVVIDKHRSAPGWVRAPPFVAMPPPDMRRHLEELLASGEGSDVMLEAGGELFCAHRCMLAARSPVFKAELFGSMMEATNNGTVHVGEIEPKVFKAMLQFIYTDALPEVADKEDEPAMSAMSQHLLEAADRFCLHRLKLMCEDKLCKNIDTSCVVINLLLAEQHGCQGLKEACFVFLKSPTNLAAAMATEGFDHLATSYPTVVKELMSKLAVR